MPLWIDYEFTYHNLGRNIKISADCLVSFFMQLRIYLVLRIITKVTKYRSNKSLKICKEEGLEADTMFSIKCLLHDNPYFILLIGFIISSLSFGVAVRTLERPYY